ncbi:MAG: AhpC/TSA family protein [Anaerolineae bacterium]|nr:AhpC/TSA family protein [Anaerolineae bacterium]
MRQIATTRPDYPPILFFYQGTVAEGQRFFAELWPEARAVSDKAKKFYHAFGLKQGSLGQMFGPEVVACGLKAALKGNTVGQPVGDPWQMPGLFLVRGPAILWQHDYRHIGDHPDFAEIGARLVSG